MQSACLVKKLLIVSCLLIMSCSHVEEVITQDGETYLVNKKSVLFVPVKKTQERITVTQEEFEERLKRQNLEHDAKMERQKEDQKLRQQQVCTWAVGVCIAIGVACLFLGYITKKVAWFGGLSLLSFAASAGVAIFGDLLHWIHSASGYIIIVVVGVGTLYLFRRFSLLEWIKVNILNSKEEN